MQDRPIVVGVDGTTTALRAVAWAAARGTVAAAPAAAGARRPVPGNPGRPRWPDGGTGG